MKTFLFLILLSLQLSGCSGDSATADTTAPTLSNSTLTLTPSGTIESIRVNWNAAADNVTAQADIEYKVVYSTSNNLTNVSDAEANGTIAMNFTKNTTSFTAASLGVGVTYYFNVIAEDATGNKSSYTSGSATTITCFLPETLITLADGTTKRIDEISAGDKILSFDASGKVSISEVGSVLKLQADEYLEISTGQNKVRVTPTHEFYAGPQAIENARHPGFQAIGKFNADDFVYLYSGGKYIEADRLLSIKAVKETVVVYNLVMSSGPPTFFANGFAVHNGC